MNVQTKAAAAMKKKRNTKYLDTTLKDVYIKQALTAKHLGKVKTLVGFWRSVPQLSEAIGRTGWYQAARQDVRIQLAYNLKATAPAIVEDQLPRPPPGGLFLCQEGDMYVYECGCRISVQLYKAVIKKPPTEGSTCNNCDTNTVTWTQTKLANAAICQLIHNGNNQENLEWNDDSPSSYVAPETFKGTTAWESILPFNKDSYTARMLKMEKDGKLGPVPLGTLAWKDYLETIDGFNQFLQQPIKFRQVHIDSMKPLNHTMETRHGKCPSDFSLEQDSKWKWNPKQVLENCNDGVFRLATFDNDDYACIGSLPLPDKLIVDIAKKDTQQIPLVGFSSRCGSAAEPHYVSENGVNCRGRSACTKGTNHVLAKKSAKSHNPGYSIEYINVNKKEEGIKRRTLYKDIYMARLGKDTKHELVENDVDLQMRMIAEMKSRLSFFLLLVHTKLENAHDLFLTLAQAAIRVMEDDKLWPEHGDFERVLLEYACGTGEMKNFVQLGSHVDGNRSHLVETMTVFGRVPHNDSRSNSDIVSEMKPALLLLPYQKLVCKLVPGRDILHCKFLASHHLPDYSRNNQNYSCVHGP
jgi:hypothetical protein